MGEERERSGASLATKVGGLATRAGRGYAADVAGSLLLFAYLMALMFGAIAVLIGAAIVSIVGFYATHAILPAADTLFGIGWFVLFLVLLFLGIRRIVMATRGVQRRMTEATSAIAGAQEVAGTAESRVAGTADPPSPSLAELDARLAPVPAEPPDSRARLP